MYSLLYQNMQDACKEMGLRICYHITEQSAIATKNLKKFVPEDYKLPNFDVTTKENKKNEAK